MTIGNDTRRIFLERLRSQSGFEKLFEFLPDISFWIKNDKFEFVMGNQAVVERCGRREEDEIIGKTDFDFFPAELAENFRRDDQRVMQNREKILNRVELVPNEDGTVDWCTTNKIPVFSKEGTVMGVAGTTKKFRKAGYDVQPNMEMSNVLEFINHNYMRQIDVNDLAEMSGFSVSHFGRKFKQLFALSPSRYINKIRVKAACKALISSRASLLSIAGETGFCDQSYFSKQFKIHVGMPPKAYRAKFYKGS
jgi:PAS domain S-box-containing protein